MKNTQGVGFSQIIQLGRRDRGLTSSRLPNANLQKIARGWYRRGGNRKLYEQELIGRGEAVRSAV